MSAHTRTPFERLPQDFSGLYSQRDLADQLEALVKFSKMGDADYVEGFGGVHFEVTRSGIVARAASVHGVAQIAMKSVAAGNDSTLWSSEDGRPFEFILSTREVRELRDVMRASDCNAATISGRQGEAGVKLESANGYFTRTIEPSKDRFEVADLSQVFNASRHAFVADWQVFEGARKAARQKFGAVGAYVNVQINKKNKATVSGRTLDRPDLMVAKLTVDVSHSPMIDLPYHFSLGGRFLTSALPHIRKLGKGNFVANLPNARPSWGALVSYCGASVFYFPVI